METVLQHKILFSPFNYESYRELADDLAKQLVPVAIAAAPLCKQLYLELCRPITHAHFVRVLINRLLWYRKKAWLLISSRSL